MNVYFVRQGQGHHNANNLYSHPDFELTELGKNQAEFAANRLESVLIDKIIVSSYTRTKQTAEIINKKHRKPVEFTNLAIEIIRPSEIAGKNMDDQESKKIRQLMEENLHDPNWHYSDEENFFDLRNRTQKFLDYLSQFNEENLLVVTHAVFIKMTLMVMMFSEKLTPDMYQRAYNFLELETSGLTWCKYDRVKKDWQLITWNDHSHLADTKANASKE